MNKVVKSAAEAVRDVPGRRHGDGVGLRPVRDPGEPDPGPARSRGEGPDRGLEQRRRHRFRGLRPAEERTGPQDDRDLRRREQAVRGHVPRRLPRGRAQPAGHLLRAHPRGRGRHPGLLHAGRSRHGRGRGQGGALVLRQALPDGDGPAGRLRARQGLEGRHGRQPRLPAHEPQLRPDDVPGRAHHHRRGRAPRPRGRHRPRRRAHARHLRPPPLPGSRLGEAHRAAHPARAGERRPTRSARAS